MWRIKNLRGYFLGDIFQIQSPVWNQPRREFSSHPKMCGTLVNPQKNWSVSWDLANLVWSHQFAPLSCSEEGAIERKKEIERERGAIGERSLASTTAPKVGRKWCDWVSQGSSTANQLTLLTGTLGGVLVERTQLQVWQQWFQQLWAMTWNKVSLAWGTWIWGLSLSPEPIFSPLHSGSPFQIRVQAKVVEQEDWVERLFIDPFVIWSSLVQYHNEKGNSNEIVSTPNVNTLSIQTLPDCGSLKSGQWNGLILFKGGNANQHQFPMASFDSREGSPFSGEYLCIFQGAHWRETRWEPTIWKQ